MLCRDHELKIFPLFLDKLFHAFQACKMFQKQLELGQFRAGKEENSDVIPNALLSVVQVLIKEM